MDWSIELIEEVKIEIRAFPTDFRASFAHIADMLTLDGPFQVGMPYVRPLEKKLWEMRLKGRDGIARAIYFTASERRIIVVRAFVKKTEKTPRKEIEIALRRMRNYR